jgi:hypothetical protein
MKHFLVLIFGLFAIPTVALSSRSWTLSASAKGKRFSQLAQLRGGQEAETFEEVKSENTLPLVSAVTPKLSIMTATFATAGHVYSRFLQQRPIITKSCTAGLIFGLSDYLAQVSRRK